MLNWLRTATKAPMTVEQFEVWLTANDFERDARLVPSDRI